MWYAWHVNKTIYLRDEDAPLWEAARELSGDKLSPVIVEYLRKFVAEKEAEAKGNERIVIEFTDSKDFDKPKAKGFYGRWIFPLTSPFKIKNSINQELSYAIAESAKGKVVVYLERRHSDGRIQSRELRVQDSFDLQPFGTELDRLALHAALKKRGVPVEELDI